MVTSYSTSIKDTLTPRGKEVVDNVAAQLKETGAKEVKVAGYTDRLGSDAYNLDLSQRRANRVKARLIQDGVTSEITAVGYGKVPQVKACNGYKHASKAEKDCLRPNRRVEINCFWFCIKITRRWSSLTVELKVQHLFIKNNQIEKIERA